MQWRPFPLPTPLFEMQNKKKHTRVFLENSQIFLLIFFWLGRVNTKLTLSLRLSDNALWSCKFSKVKGYYLCTVRVALGQHTDDRPLC
jgi:hypothetical protein